MIMANLPHPEKRGSSEEEEPNQGSIRYDQLIEDSKNSGVPRTFVDKFLSMVFTAAGISFKTATSPIWIPIWTIRKVLISLAIEGSKMDRKNANRLGNKLIDEWDPNHLPRPKDNKN